MTNEDREKLRGRLTRIRDYLGKCPAPAPDTAAAAYHEIAVGDLDAVISECAEVKRTARKRAATTDSLDAATGEGRR